MSENWASQQVEHSGISGLLMLASSPECRHIIQSIIEHLPCGVTLFDQNLEMVACNCLFRRLLDFPATLFEGSLPSMKSLAMFNARRGEYGPGDPEELAGQVVQRAMAMKPHQFERVRPDGTILEISGQPLPSGGFITLYTDITERREAEETLRDKEGLLRLIFDNSSVAIFTIDSSGRIGAANQRMAEMFMMPLESLISMEYVDLVDPVEQETARKNMADHLVQDRANVNLERHYWRSNGTAFWGQLTARHMPAYRDGRAGLVCVVSDITERKIAEQHLAERSHELEVLNQELSKTVAALAASNAELVAAREELEHLARHDTLTGAWSRIRIEESAQQEMLRNSRYGHPVSLIFIDLDHFKRVNDGYGHAVGDEVLKTFCDIAQKCMRSTDLLGRWGGEEFVIVTPNSGLMIAILLAERIRKAVMAFDFPGVGHVTASFGVAEYREDETWESWLCRSDAALYAAKEGGRNRVVTDACEADEADEAELLDLSFLRLVWRSTYESGHALLDTQHRNLFEHANNLLTAVIGERPTDEVAPQIEALVADLLDHFRDEEAVFRSIGYSGADEHAQTHQGLIDRAGELVAIFTSGELALGDLFNFLAYDVVAKHMLSEDRKFFGHIQAVRDTAV
ncbi:Putative diguanylate cyclase with hemerythrin-like metal-binding domain-containing protein [Magnetospirillum sp. XM-1]|uniref:diguanylate cyclase n=1 Tax=Magnetospirillum sp. XM-1 TaxID=1663591 RepID=UPI00073DDA77|nr:diguanylate cyclase [Magnetospirillum sp. XM-1]CUW39904.1 Putative diguanylate cyclase with hemerythrin-like metal-binding domain-containing protein [Magnetospirillum sp. XM-1]